MFKKIIKYFLVVLFIFVLVGCENPDNGKDPDGGKDPDQTDNYEYKTPQTDKLKLTASYEGKDFITDGIGEVTVSQYVDGDTTNFRTKSGKTFTTRYLGINTPESTYKVEPWGFAASNYTKKVLKDAYKIVLQCDDMNNRVDTTGERYLAWVWIISEDGDSRLLNLELAEVALAKVKASDTSLSKVFTDAMFDVSTARCRIYGYNNDPDYDYSKESKSMSIKEIRETYGTKEATLAQKDKGAKVVISGVVSRLDGTNSCFVQQYDEETNKYYGVYVYGGFTPKGEFKLGNSVVIEGKIGYYYGSIQITDIKVKLRSWAPEDPNQAINIDVIEDTSVVDKENTIIFGNLVNLSNLTVTGGSNADSNAFTIYTSYKKADGSTGKLDIRVGQNINLVGPDGERITTYKYFEGKTIKSLNAIISYYDYDTDDNEYDGRVQMMLTSYDDIVIE